MMLGQARSGPWACRQLNLAPHRPLTTWPVLHPWRSSLAPSAGGSVTAVRGGQGAPWHLAESPKQTVDQPWDRVSQGPSLGVSAGWTGSSGRLGLAGLGWEGCPSDGGPPSQAQSPRLESPT